MLKEKDSSAALNLFFKKNKLGKLTDLFHLLKANSRMSVFRRLRELHYLSSYTHAGSYYTLNNIPDFDSGSRKKSGTSSLSKTLKAMIANTPLVKNLNIPEYIDIILDGKKNLAERFAEIDIASVRTTLQQEDETARKYPKGMAKIFKIADLPNKIGQIAFKKCNLG